VLTLVIMLRILSLPHFGVECETGRIPRVKRYWETIADNVSKAG
jgi:hypothetical protein